MQFLTPWHTLLYTMFSSDVSESTRMRIPDTPLDDVIVRDFPTSKQNGGFATSGSRAQAAASQSEEWYDSECYRSAAADGVG